MKWLKVISLIWIYVAIAVILLGTLTVGITQGFWPMMNLFNPFNVVNFLVMTLFLAPGIVGYYIATKKKDGV